MNSPQQKASIGGKEMTAMLTVLVGAHAFLNYPVFASEAGYEAAWMVPLLSGILVLILVFLIDAMFRRFRNDAGLPEICRRCFGSFATGIIAILFALYLLAITASIMRQFMENVLTTVLPTTPIYVVGAIFIGAVVYIAFCGLESVARIGFVAVPVLVLGVIVLCLSTANWWDSSLLLPFWGAGWVQVVWGSLRGSSIFANVLLLCILRAHAHDASDFRYAGVRSTIYSTLILTMFLVVYHMTFGPDEAAKMTSPMYSMARIIHLGRFVQRMESVFIFMWVSAAVVKMAITLWAAAYFLSVGFAWPTYRPILPALGLLCFAAAMLPNDIRSVEAIQTDYIWRYGWIFGFALPILSIALAMIVERRRRRVRTS